MSKDNSGRPVVVCTDKRGVFFGYVDDYVKGQDPIILKNLRMCVYWSAATKGVIGLAATGPASGSKVTKPIPAGELRGVTCVLDCAPEAVKQWEETPWS